MIDVRSPGLPPRGYHERLTARSLTLRNGVLSIEAGRRAAGIEKLRRNVLEDFET